MALICKLARNPNATPVVMYTNCFKCAVWSLDGCTYMNGAVFVDMWPFVCVNDDGQMDKTNMVVWYGLVWQYGGMAMMMRAPGIPDVSCHAKRRGSLQVWC